MGGAPPTDPDAAPGADQPQDDTRAREVLEEAGTPRRVVGQGLAERVGARRWERAPVVCCSERIFQRCELADPWDPDASDRPIAVGPVGMRFEERRQPAPHARVKEPKKPSSGPAWSAPPGIPKAASKPAPAESAAAAARRPSQAVADEQAEPSAGRSLPPVKPPPAAAKSRSGRFRMRSTSATGPKVRPLPVVSAPSAPEPESPPPEPEPPKPAPQPQGLDDLFGSLGGGRDKRVGRKKQ